MRKSQLPIKLSACVLSLILFSTNSLLAYTPQINFWSERRQSVLGQNKVFDPHSDHHFPVVSPHSIQTPSPLTSLCQALSLPYGQIRKITPASRPLPFGEVIHIQDVHLNQEAQSNIEKTLLKLAAHKKIDMVAIEGAFSAIDLRDFQNFPHQDTIHEMADYLRRGNEISGAMSAALQGGPSMAPLIGIDDKKAYLQNVRAYRQAFSRQPSVVAEHERLKRFIKDRKKVVLNFSLSQFDQYVEDFRSGKISLGDYARFLASTQPKVPTEIKNFLQALNMESKLDSPRIESERNRLIGELAPKLNELKIAELTRVSMSYRAGTVSHTDFYGYLKELCTRGNLSLGNFPAMNDYFQYVLLSGQLDVGRIITEIQRMEMSRYQALTYTDAESFLIQQSRFIYLAGKLIDFALTPEEWNEFKTIRGHHGHLLTDLSFFEDFYRHAEDRDRIMTENLHRAINQSGAKVAVLVTGGFHSAGMTPRMVRNGFNVITYIPKLTNISNLDGPAYLSVFNQEKTPLEKLFQGETLFLSPLQNNPALKEQSRIMVDAREMHLQRSSPTLRSRFVSFKRAWRDRVIYEIRNQEGAVQIEVGLQLGDYTFIHQTNLVSWRSMVQQWKAFWDRVRAFGQEWFIEPWLGLLMPELMTSTNQRLSVLEFPLRIQMSGDSPDSPAQVNNPTPAPATDENPSRLLRQNIKERLRSCQSHTDIRNALNDLFLTEKNKLWESGQTPVTKENIDSVMRDYSHLVLVLAQEIFGRACEIHHIQPRNICLMADGQIRKATLMPKNTLRFYLVSDIPENRAAFQPIEEALNTVLGPHHRVIVKYQSRTEFMDYLNQALDIPRPEDQGANRRESIHLFQGYLERVSDLSKLIYVGGANRIWDEYAMKVTRLLAAEAGRSSLSENFTNTAVDLFNLLISQDGYQAYVHKYNPTFQPGEFNVHRAFEIIQELVYFYGPSIINPADYQRAYAVWRGVLWDIYKNQSNYYSNVTSAEVVWPELRKALYKALRRFHPNDSGRISPLEDAQLPVSNVLALRHSDVGVTFNGQPGPFHKVGFQINNETTEIVLSQDAPPDFIALHPEWILYVFELSARLGYPISEELMDVLKMARSNLETLLISSSDRSRIATVKSSFLRILSSPTDISAVLWLLFEFKIPHLLISEYRAIENHHHGFEDHHYTIDAHMFKVMEVFEKYRFIGPENMIWPLAWASSLSEKEALLAMRLTLLLHDIGRAAEERKEGWNHDQMGAYAMVPQILSRFDYGPESPLARLIQWTIAHDDVLARRLRGSVTTFDSNTGQEELNPTLVSKINLILNQVPDTHRTLALRMLLMLSITDEAGMKPFLQQVAINDPIYSMLFLKFSESGFDAQVFYEQEIKRRSEKIVAVLWRLTQGERVRIRLHNKAYDFLNQLINRKKRVTRRHIQNNVDQYFGFVTVENWIHEPDDQLISEILLLWESEINRKKYPVAMISAPHDTPFNRSQPIQVVFLASRNQRGMLKRFAALLTAHQLNILDAGIRSNVVAVGGKEFILDRFTVGYIGPDPNPNFTELEAQISDDIQFLFKRKRTIKDLFEMRRKIPLEIPIKAFRADFAPFISGDRYQVLNLEGPQDFPGFILLLTMILDDVFEVNIQHAEIATEGIIKDQLFIEPVPPRTQELILDAMNYTTDEYLPSVRQLKGSNTVRINPDHLISILEQKYKSLIPKIMTASPLSITADEDLKIETHLAFELIRYMHNQGFSWPSHQAELKSLLEDHLRKLEGTKAQSISSVHQGFDARGYQSLRALGFPAAIVDFFERYLVDASDANIQSEILHRAIAMIENYGSYGSRSIPSGMMDIWRWLGLIKNNGLDQLRPSYPLLTGLLIGVLEELIIRPIFRFGILPFLFPNLDPGAINMVYAALFATILHLKIVAGPQWLLISIKRKQEMPLRMIQFGYQGSPQAESSNPHRFWFLNQVRLRTILGLLAWGLGELSIYLSSEPTLIHGFLVYLCLGLTHGIMNMVAQIYSGQRWWNTWPMGIMEFKSSSDKPSSELMLTVLPNENGEPDRDPSNFKPDIHKIVIMKVDSKGRINLPSEIVRRLPQPETIVHEVKSGGPLILYYMTPHQFAIKVLSQSPDTSGERDIYERLVGSYSAPCVVDKQGQRLSLKYWKGKIFQPGDKIRIDIMSNWAKLTILPSPLSKKDAESIQKAASQINQILKGAPLSEDIHHADRLAFQLKEHLINESPHKLEIMNILRTGLATIFQGKPNFDQCLWYVGQIVGQATPSKRLINIIREHAAQENVLRLVMVTRDQEVYLDSYVEESLGRKEENVVFVTETSGLKERVRRKLASMNVPDAHVLNDHNKRIFRGGSMNHDYILNWNQLENDLADKFGRPSVILNPSALQVVASRGLTIDNNGGSQLFNFDLIRQALLVLVNQNLEAISMSMGHLDTMADIARILHEHA